MVIVAGMDTAPLRAAATPGREWGNTDDGRGAPGVTPEWEFAVEIRWRAVALALAVGAEAGVKTVVESRGARSEPDARLRSSL